MNDSTPGRTDSVVMVGLPRTGKTTYLAALYHVLESGDGGSITLEQLPELRRYLQEIRVRWLKVEAESRTSSSAPIVSTFALALHDSGKNLELTWPDLSGEHFVEMVRKRTMDRDVDRLLDGATALLFFIHPETLTQEPRISEIERLARMIDDELPVAINCDTNGNGRSENNSGSEDGSEPENVPVKEWDPEMIPGEVLTLELLQLVRARYFENDHCRVSVIVSAWDLLRGRFESPQQWFDTKLPMLSQYFEANTDNIQTRLFGVSALGGDAKSDREMLLSKTDPRERITVVSADGESEKDGILAPIGWLIS